MGIDYAPIITWVSVTSKLFFSSQPATNGLYCPCINVLIDLLVLPLCNHTDLARGHSTSLIRSGCSPRVVWFLSTRPVELAT